MKRENDKLEAVVNRWVVCKYGEIRGIGLKKDLEKYLIDVGGGYELREVRVEFI